MSKDDDFVPSVFTPPGRLKMPDFPEKPHLIQIDDDFWVQPDRVTALLEKRYEGPPVTWQVWVYVRGQEHPFTLSDTRVATVAAKINGEDLR